MFRLLILGSDILIAVEELISFRLAVMVTVPVIREFTVVLSPEESLLMASGTLDDQFTESVTSCLVPSLRMAIACRGASVPLGKIAGGRVCIAVTIASLMKNSASP